MSRNSMRRLLAGAAALAAVSLAGCAVYPAAPYPVYAGGYGYYAPPVVVGFGGSWGGYWGRGRWR